MKNGKSRTGAAVLTLMLLAAAVWQFQPGGMAERMAQTDGEAPALPGVQEAVSYTHLTLPTT